MTYHVPKHFNQHPFCYKLNHSVSCFSGDELLSAFKVASFATNTDEELTTDLKDPGENEEESKDWDEIIPETLRKKVEEEEKAKEMEDLYLPPRSRKTLQQVNQSDEEGEGRRGRKRRGGEEKEEGSGDSSYDEDESDEERPKKRGRPKANSKESVKGLCFDVHFSKMYVPYLLLS